MTFEKEKLLDAELNEIQERLLTLQASEMATYQMLLKLSAVSTPEQAGVISQFGKMFNESLEKLTLAIGDKDPDAAEKLSHRLKKYLSPAPDDSNPAD